MQAQTNSTTQPRFAKILNPREVRKATGLNQLEFWGIRNSRLMKMTSSPLFTDPRRC